MTMPKLTMAVCCLLVAGNGSPGYAQAREATQAPLSSPENVVRVLTELPLQAEGWSLSGAPVVWNPGNLRQRLGDEAATFLAYGYRWSVSATLLGPGLSRPLTVDVFDMTDDLGAFGVYTLNQSEKAVAAQILNASYWVGNQLHVWRGPLYLRLRPPSNDRVPRSVVYSVGLALAGSLPQPAPLPLLYRLMPEGNRVPLTMRYYRSNALGQPSLGEGMAAAYADSGQRLTFLLLRSADPIGAERTYADVARWLKTAAEPRPLPDLGQQAELLRSPEHGLCYVMREGRYVAAALDVPNRELAEGLLRIAGTNIRILR